MGADGEGAVPTLWEALVGFVVAEVPAFVDTPP